MTSTASEQRPSPAATTWHAEWLVSFDTRAGASAASGSARRWASHASSFSVARSDGSDLRIADDEDLVVLFCGWLTNASELEEGAAQADAARLALDLVKARGAGGLDALRGPFGVIAWNRREGTLLVGRDQIGLEPLFYARVGSHNWLLSPSPDVLASQPGVSREADAVAMSEWLCGWFPATEDTAYRDVKRVPPGSAMTLPDGAIRRYWDPFDEARPVEWLREEDLGQFEGLLRRAVSRATQGLAPAIFLSGGVDSISVALTASDLANGDGRPLALSLVFPDPQSSEESIQAGVARQLGIEQVLVPFDDAAGPRGLLAAALDLSGTWPQPMWNIWSPAYTTLARQAMSRGRRVILTGRGGDEWLTISPYLLADQLRRGDLAGMWRLLQMRRRSNNLRSARAMARLVWLTACRPLGSAALDAIAPGPWHRRRRQKLWAARPAWVAPDPAIRRAMEGRLNRWIDEARPRQGFYHREGRTALRHPAITHDMEETQEFGRRHDARMLHPFWDVDLIEMLHRVPPDLLMADGRSKSLLRRRLGARLPGLGLESRGKISAGHVFRGVMERETPAVLRNMGGVQALSRMGAVASADIESEAQRLAGPGRLWTLLNLENWVRRRA